MDGFTKTMYAMVTKVVTPARISVRQFVASRSELEVPLQPLQRRSGGHGEEGIVTGSTADVRFAILSGYGCDFHHHSTVPARLLRGSERFSQSAALRAAIELDVFTAVADGATTPPALAGKCQASERGMRILCDFLTVEGFLHKTGSQYSLPMDRRYS